MLKRAKRFLWSAFMCLSALANAQTLENLFETKGHPKASNLSLSVRYPSEMVAKDGNAPGVIQKFTGEYTGVRSQLMLQVRDAGVKNIEPECKTMTEKKWIDAFTDIKSGIKANAAKKLQVEGKPAVIIDSTSYVEKDGYGVSMATKQMTVCYKDKMIVLSCIAPVHSKNINEALQNLGKIDTLCNMYFNSLILVNSQ
jgi:hypothetical protein